MSTPLNANMPSNTLASVTTPIANTTPVHKVWVNRPVNHPLLVQSKMTLPPLLRSATIQVGNSTQLPSSPSLERCTLSKVVPTSSTPLPLHDDPHGHTYTHDLSLPLSSLPSALPSPMWATWNIKDWLMRLQNSSTVAKKKVTNALFSKKVGSKDCKTMSASYTLILREPSKQPNRSLPALKSKASHHQVPPRPCIPSSSHSGSIN